MKNSNRRHHNKHRQAFILEFEKLKSQSEAMFKAIPGWGMYW